LIDVASSDGEATVDEGSDAEDETGQDKHSGMEIAEKFLERELAFLLERDIEIRSRRDVLPTLVRKGFYPKRGARPMRDTLERLVGDSNPVVFTRAPGLH